MSANFLGLPSEIRNKIYEHVLVDQESINPWTRPYPSRPLTPELLRANKTIHRETSSLLYAQNHFYLTAHDSDVVAFLDEIGRNNANYIRHISIAFPEFRDLDRHNVTLEDDSVRILAKIQSDCTNLSTLTTTLFSTDIMTFKLDALDSPDIVVEALALVNTHFRAIPSLQEIVVQIYEGPSDHIRSTMENYGWTIKVAEQVDELDSSRSIGSIEDDDYDDYRYDHNSDDNYEYDIDNDSDFWRRAGD
jgi:hypothetical protein